MSGIGLTVDLTGLPALEALLGRLEHLDGHAILRPIREEETAPDGTPWPPNRVGPSTLLPSGAHRHDRLPPSVSGAEAEGRSSRETAEEIETIVVDDLGNLLP